MTAKFRAVQNRKTRITTRFMCYNLIKYGDFEWEYLILKISDKDIIFETWKISWQGMPIETTDFWGQKQQISEDRKLYSSGDEYYLGTDYFQVGIWDLSIRNFFICEKLVQQTDTGIQRGTILKFQTKAFRTLHSRKSQLQTH